MGNNLRCCLACVLPCGALDLIRIVHLNGYVEELTGRVTAGEFLQNYPNHVITKPCSETVSRRILILSAESDLKRGSIYFLVPSSSLPSCEESKKSSMIKYNSPKQQTITAAAAEERYTASSRGRKVTAGVWRPHLDSISEL